MSSNKKETKMDSASENQSSRTESGTQSTENAMASLERMAKLHKDGLLTDAEFSEMKQNLLKPQITSSNSSEAKGGISNSGANALSKPKLWNPSTATWLGLLFTPVFGMVIHALNWRTLGEAKRFKAS